MPPNPVSDPFRCFPVDHLGPPWGGIDMTMAAGLIALAADVDLEGLQAVPAQVQAVLG
jgi:hypothetical protein